MCISQPFPSKREHIAEAELVLLLRLPLFLQSENKLTTDTAMACHIGVTSDIAQRVRAWITVASVGMQSANRVSLARSAELTAPVTESQTPFTLESKALCWSCPPSSVATPANVLPSYPRAKGLRHVGRVPHPNEVSNDTILNTDLCSTLCPAGCRIL